MATRKRSPTLFISHSSKDEELTRCLLETIKTFYEIPDDSIRASSLVGYQLQGGSNIAATLQTEIRHAKAVIGILTPNSMASPWVLWELGAVWGLVANFVPVVAGLGEANPAGPLAAAHVWRLGDIDDVRSSLDEVGRHLGSAAKSRRLSRSDEAKALDELVAFSKKYRPDTDAIPASELYSLQTSSKKIRTSSDIFQDFAVSRVRGANVNPVHGLWADTFTNGRITASVITEANDQYLRIWFESGFRSESQGERAKGWASNIQIRPQDETALGNENEQGDLRHKVLRFLARTPPRQPESGDIDEVALSVRLVDRRLTSWVYSTSFGAKFPTQFQITNDWQSFRVMLRARILHSLHGQRQPLDPEA